MLSTNATALLSGTIDTPIGAIAVLEDQAGALFMVEFSDCEHRIERWLRRRFDSGRYVLAPGFLSVGIRDIFGAYFDGDVSILRDIPLRLDGTPFQNEMWTALRGIEPGETLGISNAATGGPVSVDVHEGRCLVILPRSEVLS